MLTDPIAQFLTQLRNVSHARKIELSVRSSKMVKAIAQILKNKGFIEDFQEIEGKLPGSPMLSVTLKSDRDPLELKRISKPGQRIYVGFHDVKRVRSGLGVGIISTSAGILSDDEARQKKVGGEYICEVY